MGTNRNLEQYAQDVQRMRDDHEDYAGPFSVTDLVLGFALLVFVMACVVAMIVWALVSFT